MAFINFLLSVLFVHISLQAEPIFTNAVVVHDPPKWLKRTRVEKVVDRIQTRLEWSTRRIQVYWHSTQESFQSRHSLGPLPQAVAIKSEKSQEIHLGPKVNDANFDWVFGHELVHIIIFQKYRGAIPKWLEEGLASHLAKKTNKIDYAWLAKRPFPTDVRQMTHPLKGDTESVVYHYAASQALAEMLDKKCNLENLIRLSVERKMEDYIVTYCEIKDINKAFQEWVKSKSRS